MSNVNGKRLESIKIHVDERLKRLIQDAAMEDNRSVSEWIRVQLEGQLFIRAVAGDFVVHGEKLQQWLSGRRGDEGN